MRTPEPRHRGSVEDPNSPPPPSLPAAPPEASRPSHLGFVAHEIRNPMSTALWTAELLGRMSPAERAGDRGDKLTSLCFRSLTKVRLLVEDHLLCERLDAGAAVLTMTRTAWGPDGRGIELGSHLYRADRYAFVHDVAR